MYIHFIVRLLTLDLIVMSNTKDICVYTLFSVNRIVAVEVYKYYLNGINDILSNMCVAELIYQIPAASVHEEKQICIFSKHLCLPSYLSSVHVSIRDQNLQLTLKED